MSLRVVTGEEVMAKRTETQSSAAGSARSTGEIQPTERKGTPPLDKTPPAAPQPESIFIGLNRETGGLTIASIDADFEILLDGRLLNVSQAIPRESRIDRINRIADSGFTAEKLSWCIGNPADAVAPGRNFGPEWTLEDGHTLFAATQAGPDEAPVTFTFVSPAEGPDIAIQPGRSYTFQAFFGLHRTRAVLRFTFSNDAGELVGASETGIDTEAKGGRSLADYLSRHLTAEAPEGATRLRIEIVKNLTNPGDQDSFLFFTRPSLIRSATGAGYAYLQHDLPERFTVAAFAHAGDHLFTCDLPIPDAALDGAMHKVSARSRKSGNMASVAVALPDSVRASAVIHGLEGSTLIASMRLPGGWTTPVGVALWVDGQPQSGRHHMEPGDQFLRIPLPVSVCDGRPHVFEIRLAYSGQLLSQYACLGPVSVTPWDALQKYSGMPLPSQLSPLASYRYLSLSEGVSSAAVASGVPVGELHDILVEGFDKPRRHFRPLPFPAADAPDVSIVIPVHNKFDVTYVCLAALLFAATTASFEVIVVDDGSSDTTRKLPAIAPGVVYVRNDTPLGFVGACNAGAAKARGRYIVFLNNDTEPTAHWLDELLFVFENFDGVGLAGSKMIYPDGLLQEAGGIVWGSGDPWNYGRRANPYEPRFSYSRICDYVSGAAIMIPRELWTSIGGFSREFMPAYFEDTDLAFKVKDAGKKVVFVPQSIIVHYEGLSNGTDQTASSGLKRFQEINRPKFKRKWANLFATNGKVGENVDLAKDRGISKRVLFVDYEVPHLDRDAGSYAAIQEIRMFQALGCKVTFLPLNMAYLGRHTDFLQRIGVEVLYTPFGSSPAAVFQARGSEFDMIYITRYGVMENVEKLIADHAPHAHVVLNVADLHFLRKIRDAMADGNNQEKMAEARLTRDAEISALSKAELILTYSHIEQAVITSHITHGPKAGLLPWVVDPVPLKRSFAERRDIAFMGGYRHYPNVDAVKFFATEVMPLLRGTLPGVRFRIYGSMVPPEVEALAAEDILIEGYVADIAEIFDSVRVFVAPLLTGAGMKGKVLDCIAAGIPSVLSPVAAEGIGLRDGLDTIIARRPADWAEAIARIYNDEAAWTAMSASAHELARTQYSFAAGVAQLTEALSAIEFFTAGDPALCVNAARPVSPRHLPVTVAEIAGAVEAVAASKKK